MKSFEVDDGDEQQPMLKDHPEPALDVQTKWKRGKRHRTGIDLAFPTVVIPSHKNRLRRRQGHFYRLIGGLALCLTIIFQFFKRTVLQLPSGEKRMDLSYVKSIDQLSVDAIDSWCLTDDDACSCTNPLVPEGKQEEPRWERAHRMNMDAIQQKPIESLDVIFLGDSITEGWTGNFYRERDPRVQGAFTEFQTLFSKRHGGKYDALPQGIAGDTTPNLLWRIQNGEVGKYNEMQNRIATTPFPIFWLLIGTNDIGNENCSPDIVIVGILRIVEELLQRVPPAMVVINGLLPRTYDHSGYLLQSQGKLPVYWPIIKTINSELEHYANKRDRVEYFESYAFIKDNTTSAKELRIDPVLMTDYLHPSAPGYRKWGAEIVKKLDTIFANPKNAPGTESSEVDKNEKGSHA